MSTAYPGTERQAPSMFSAIARCTWLEFGGRLRVRVEGEVRIRVSGQWSVVSGPSQGYVLGDGALHRGVALEEVRECAAPQVERGRGCRGEADGEQQRDADEAGRDVRRAAAHVFAGRGA